MVRSVLFYHSGRLARRMRHGHDDRERTRILDRGLPTEEARLIHVPDGPVSFGRLLGSSIDEGEQALADGLEVAQAVAHRLLEVRYRVEQAVVRRPPPQLLPEPFDDVELRA